MSQDDTLHDALAEPEWPRELALDDQPGPAPVIARAKADDLIAGALARAGFDELAGERSSGAGERSSSPGRSSRAPKPGIGLRSLAAAAVLACLSIGSASAAVMYFARVRPEPARKETPAVRPKQVRPAPVIERAAPEPVPPPIAEASAPEPKRAAHVPEDLLVEGNRLRAARRWKKADDSYTRAAKDAPHSQTAYVARVASAGVRLEHLHDARGALSSYRAALAEQPHGALSEEVHWGIAESYRALGQHDKERDALQLFLREHPSSPLRAQAEARLQ